MEKERSEAISSKRLNTLKIYTLFINSILIRGFCLTAKEVI